MGGEVLLTAALLGLIEGVTEFIPVSSTGHLILASHWLGQTGEAAKTFDIFIQLGAILAIVWLYRQRLTHAVLAARSDPVSRRFLLNLLIAFLPAAIVGFLAHDWIKQRLFTPTVVASALVAGGLPEVIDDAVNGILEPVGSVEAMGRRAVELLRDPPRYAAMREAAIAKAREFSSDRIVPMYEQVYEEVLRGRPAMSRADER